MASRPTSKITFLSLDGAPLDAPLEWTPALIAIDVDPSEWGNVEVTVQGRKLAARLERVAGTERVVVPWERAGTGNYKVAFQMRDVAEEKVVTVRPQKISDDEFSELIDDLEERLPVSIALALQSTGALSGISITTSHETTLAQEVHRLRRAILGADDGVPGLASILRELALDPHRVLRTENHWVTRERARRPLATGLVQAVVRPGNLRDDGLPRRVIDQRVEHTFDVYENRLVKMFDHQVGLRLRAVRRRLLTKDQNNLIAELDTLEKALRQSRIVARFLDEVTLPEFLPLNLTMVLLRRPPYRASLERFLEFNRGMIVQLDQQMIEAPLENLPSLYQTWCTLTTIDALLELADELEFTVISHRLTHKRAGETFISVLPDGRPSLTLRREETDTTVSFTPELSFGRHGRYQSISLPQRPDITIEIRRGSSDRSTLVLFDPKYKLDSEYTSDGNPGGRPKKEDIDKMHAYRDAIRDVDGNRPVAFAGVFYPGGSIDYGNEIGALSARPGQCDSMRKSIREIVEKRLALNATP